MKTHQNSSVSDVSELARELVGRSEVQNAYTHSGQLSHVVVTLPREEFHKLYSADTDANVFIKGYWLQFSLAGSKPSVFSRGSGVRLSMVIVQDHLLNKIELSFKHGARRIAGFTSRRHSRQSLLGTTFGLQALAQAAARAFDRLGEPSFCAVSEKACFPCVHVVPQCPEEPDFRRSLVDLQ